MLGDLDKAISDYSIALAINPKLARSLYGRGLAERQRGDPNAAQEDIAAAKAIQSDIANHFTGVEDSAYRSGILRR
jgi:tetratricopeptide (TPR) repeat protein